MANNVRMPIVRTIENGREAEKIKLVRVAVNPNPPTQDRWQSFGWIVTEVNGGET